MTSASARLVPHISQAAKSSLVKKQTKNIRVRNTTGLHSQNDYRRHSTVDSRRAKKPEMKEQGAVSEGGDPETMIEFNSCPSLDLQDVEEQLQLLPVMRKHLFKLSDIVSTIGQVNSSAVISDTHVVQHTDKLVKRFRPFYQECMKYFGALKELKSNGTRGKEESIPLAELKSVAYDFVEKWKEVVGIMNVIKENGVTSLAHYIGTKFRTIDHVITDITTTNRKDSVHEESLLDTGGKLRQLLNNINSGIQMLLLHTSLSQLRADLATTHVNDVKTFLRIYNDSHYREFPKSGVCSVDLSQFKVTVMASCNDAIRAIKVAFSLNNDIQNLFAEVGEIQKLLTKVTDKLNLPQTIIRTVVKARESTLEGPQVDPLEKLKEFVGGSEMSVVVCSRIEEFIENVQIRMGFPLDPPNINVWERLDRLQTRFYEKIDSVKEVEKEVELLKSHVQEQMGEMETILKVSHDQKMRDAEIRKSMEERIASLQQQFEESEKQRQKAEEIITKKKKRIKELIVKNNVDRNEEMLHQLGDKMTEVMDDSKREFDFNHWGQKQEDIAKIEKLDVFVVEKRCSRCREFAEQRRKVKEMLKNLIGVGKGETIESVIKRLGDEVTQLRRENSDLLEQHYRDKEQIQTLMDAVKLYMDESERERLDKENAKNVIEMVKKRLEDMKRQHAQELEDQQNKFLREREEMLKEFSNALSRGVSEEEYPATTDLQQTVLYKAEKVCDKLRLTEEKLSFSENLLRKVETWMNKQSDFVTEGLPIDHALLMMMEAIEKKPNPLEGKVKELETEILMISSEIDLCSVKIDQINGKELKKAVSRDPYKTLSEMSLGIDHIVQKLGSYQARINDLELDYALAFDSLASSCEKLSRVLEISDVNYREMRMSGLVFQLQCYIDEVANPEGNRHFIAVVDLNDMTRQMRKELGMKASILPSDYIPKMAKKVIGLGRVFQYVKQFVTPLQTIFKDFDFKLGSFDPQTEQFGILREQIFRMNGIVGRIPDVDVNKTVFSVVKHFVALASSFVSCIAAMSFETLSMTEKSAAFKFQVQNVT